MPTFDLTRGAHDRPIPRRRLLLIGAALVAGALVLTVATDGDGAAVSSRLGPTVVAEARDLATTLDASGSLQRSSEHLVAYASALPSDRGGDPSESPDDSDSPAAEPVSYLPESDTTTSSTTVPSTTAPSTTAPSTTTPTSSTTSTTSPCSPTSTSPTSTTSSTTTATTPCPTTSTTTPPPSTTPTQPGDGSEPPPTDDGGPDDGAAAAPTAGPDDGDDSRPRDASPSNGGDDGAPGGDSGDDGDGGDGSEVPSATLTSVLDVGSTAGQGTVLYTADDQPVVALIGDLPAWRTLEAGVDDGADVRQLEENLVALGYGTGLEIDETFTADTTAAVEAWETDLGRAAPDGVVTIGDVVFLTAPGDVLGHEAAVGDMLDAGSPVLTIGSEQRIVVATVDAREAGGWAPGSTVELEWADGTATEGTVFGTGREVTDGQVELIVAVGAGDMGAGERPSGAAADVTLVDARRDGVVAVPVAAVVEQDGSTAVRVARHGGPDRVVPVETGLVADGWVEVTVGLDGGEEVRLPG